MEDMNVDLAHSYYEAEVVDEKVIITNLYYDKKLFIYLFYILLEYIDGFSLEFTQIPRRFIIEGKLTYIELSRKLELKTDGDYQVLYREKDVRRWFYAVFIPLFLLFIIFLLSSLISLVYLVASQMSLSVLILFLSITVVLGLLAKINSNLLEQYRNYQSIKHSKGVGI